MVEACRGVGGMSLAEITKWMNQHPEYGLRMISWYNVAGHFRHRLEGELSERAPESLRLFRRLDPKKNGFFFFFFLPSWQAFSFQNAREESSIQFLMWAHQFSPQQSTRNFYRRKNRV
jgi:hypothetical protein